MTGKTDLIAVAEDDAPEMLDADALDHIAAGGYGGSNSCEPYAGDNSCEDPGSGHASFGDLTIKREERREFSVGSGIGGFKTR